MAKVYKKEILCVTENSVKKSRTEEISGISSTTMDSIPNIFEDYDKLSPSEGEIVYLFRFNGKKGPVLRERSV